MELRDVIRKIRKYRYSFAYSIVIGAIVGIGLYFLPPRYISSGSFYIKRSISAEKNYFTYEGYYGQQTALAYTNSVVALAESLDLKKLVLEKMKVDVNEESLRKLSRMIRVRKTGPQIISITVKTDSYVESKNIWEKLSEVLLSKTYEINKDGDPNLMVVKVSDQPVVKQTYRSMYLFPLAGSFISLTLFSFFICIKGYLRD